MARTVEGQDQKNIELKQARMRSRFYDTEQQRLRMEFRRRKIAPQIPGDVKQGDARS